MKFDWQIAVVIACVAWATGVLVLRGLRLLREPGISSCGAKACHDCPSNAVRTTSTKDLVQLDLSVKRQVRPHE